VASSKLNGVRAKIDRARYHLSQLHASVQAWGSAEENDHAPALNYDQDRKVIGIVLQEVRPNDINWALIVGDVVHNLRSALDHLVCQLATLHGRSIADCKKTAFPICIDEATFAKAKRRVEPFVDPGAFALIEVLQPYKAADRAGKDARSNNLWVISQLDIIDKHRMLVIAAKYFRATDVRYTLRGITTVLPVDGKWFPLEDGAQIGSLDISNLTIEHTDEMHVQAQTEVQIFFNETGCGCDGLTVEGALRSCIRYISDIVELFDRQFFN
jgi:hypothetical protein